MNRTGYLATKKTRGTVPLVFSFLLCVFFVLGCSLENPAEKSGELSEYEYNYWLLEREYIFDDLPEQSAFSEPQALYDALQDPFTRYIVPQKAEETETSMTTSINNGTPGIELRYYGGEYPLKVYRIFPGSSAERAKVPRYATLLEANGVDLKNDNGTMYNAAIAAVDSVVLKYAYQNDTVTVELKKESLMLPTVFLDTLLTGNPIITLRKFARPTSNAELGTIGELDSVVRIIKDTKLPVVIDIRNNPGGLISQCLAAADVFLGEGIVMKTKTMGFNKKGEKLESWQKHLASNGGLGEQFDIVLFTNSKSASCAEIFTMALLQSERVHTTGTTTYGKGIGQAPFKTPIGALAYITNAMIYNEKNETYHGKGIKPEYLCETDSWNCLYNTLGALYSKAMAKSADYQFEAFEIVPESESLKMGGAILDF